MAHVFVLMMVWSRLLFCTNHYWLQRERTALIHAAENGHVECVSLLLESGADTQAKDIWVRDNEFSYVHAYVYWAVMRRL